MKRTTIYLPFQMKRAIEQLSSSSDMTESEVIRQSISAYLASPQVGAPSLPLFESAGKELARGSTSGVADNDL